MMYDDDRDPRSEFPDMIEMFRDQDRIEPRLAEHEWAKPQIDDLISEEEFEIALAVLAVMALEEEEDEAYARNEDEIPLLLN